MRYWIAIIFFVGLCQVSAQNVLLELQQEVQKTIQSTSPSIVQVHWSQNDLGDSLGSTKDKRRIVTKQRVNGKEKVIVQDFVTKNFKDVGIGIILDRDGYILTGSFIANAKDVRVTLASGKTVVARVQGVDYKTNVGLIKVEAPNLQPATLGDSDQVVPGSIILTSGNPYGMGLQASMGIVSGPMKIVRGNARLPISITVRPGDKSGPVFDVHGNVIGIIDGVVGAHKKRKFKFGGQDKLKKYLNQYNQDLEKNIEKYKEQIEKKIENLESIKDIEEYAKEIEKNIEVYTHDFEDYVKKYEDNVEREVQSYFKDMDEMEDRKMIGLDDKIVSKTIEEVVEVFTKGGPFASRIKPVDNGVNLAIPINDIKPIIQLLKTQGEVKRGWLGVEISPMPEALRHHLPLLEKNVGIQVSKVVQNSPAAQAGLQKWDIIITFAGEKVDSSHKLKKLVEQARGFVPVTILRGAKKMVLNVNVQYRD